MLDRHEVLAHPHHGLDRYQEMLVADPGRDHGHGVVVGAVSWGTRGSRVSPGAGQGEERQQLKWFTYAAALMIFGFPATLILIGIPAVILFGGDPIWDMGILVGVFGFLFFPIAVGIGILRHRLYDIDLLINRTLVYGSLTVILVLAYVVAIVLSQGVFRALTGQGSQLAVVASTLAIAALFDPPRRRLQAFVDRRFYRGKYDARKTLEAFSAKLRDLLKLRSSIQMAERIQQERACQL